MIPIQHKAEHSAANVRVGLLHDLHILVADDSAAIRFVAATALRAQGAIVQEACDGKAALTKALSSCFDIIVMDVQMPELDGTEATQTLRRAGVSIPVLALTAGNAEAAPTCIAAGMNEVLPKPFTQASLVSKVLNLLGLSAADSTAYQPPRPKSEETVLFSTDSLYALCGGDTQFMQRMLGIAVQELPFAAVEMRDALALGDKAQLARLSHRVRPCVGGLGILVLAEKLLQLEAMLSEETDSSLLENHALAIADELEGVARLIIHRAS